MNTKLKIFLARYTLRYYIEPLVRKGVAETREWLYRRKINKIRKNYKSPAEILREYRKRKEERNKQRNKDD